MKKSPGASISLSFDDLLTDEGNELTLTAEEDDGPTLLVRRRTEGARCVRRLDPGRAKTSMARVFRPGAGRAGSGIGRDRDGYWRPLPFPTMPALLRVL